MEDYNWDGEPDENDKILPYYKFKGGTTYLVDVELERSDSYHALVTELRDLIECSGGSEVIVTRVQLVDCDFSYPNAKISEPFRFHSALQQAITDHLEPWENSYIVTKADNVWRCCETRYEVDNSGDEPVRGRAEWVARWDMLPEGDRENYSTKLVC
jgi:hypothetical protein